MPFNYHSRKYTLNEDFFSSWSPDMAYVLGFWFADGYMRHDKSYRITFSSHDKNHLENIRQVVQTTIPLVQYRRRGKLEENFTLILRSKSLFQQLQALGGIRRKSLVIEWPYIPDTFLADFLRGYFDGDGSVHFITYKRTKDKRKQIDLRSNFTSGSPKFLNTLRDLLTKKLGLFSRKVCVYGNGNQWKLGYGSIDTLKLLKFMYYPGCTLYLSRKEVYSHYQRVNRALWAVKS